MSIDVNVQNDLVIVTESSEDITVNVSNAAGPAGVGVPTGGSAGEVLKKLSGTDYDTYWALDGGGVPYSGATGNVDLGEYELKAGQVEFDQTPTGAAGVGVMRWNDSDGTVDLGLKGGNVTLQVGQEQVLRVVNKTGADLLESQYRAVRIRLVSEGGSQGQRLAVVLAQGDNDPDSTTTIGIVTETIANNQEGFITTSGEVRGINTTGSLQGETWLDGDIIYLSPTVPGGITKVKPTAPDHMVVLGYVIYAHVNNGKIFVKVDNGYELGELHDVYVPSPSNNDGIFWNTANSRYQNNSITGVLGYTPVPTTRTITINGTTLDLSADRTYTVSASATPAGANTQIQYNNSGAFGASAGLVYNDSTGAMTLSKNQNASTYFLVSNTTSGTLATSVVAFTNNQGIGFGQIGLNSTLNSGTKIISGNDLFLYKTGAGDIALMADFGTAKIKFAAGGSSTAQMTLTAAGRLLLGLTAESTFLLDVNGSARVSGNLTINTNGQGQLFSTFFPSGSGGLNIYVGGGGQSSTTGGGSTNNGSYNSSFGALSMSANTIGQSNSAFGVAALYVNTSGNFNAAFGGSSLSSNISGLNNSAFGIQSLQYNISGNFNVAVGESALWNNTGSNNTAIGRMSGYGSGSSQFNTSGTNNIFVGYQSVGVSSTESNRTWIGNSSTTSTWLGGNLLLGTTTNSTFLLDVNGTARVSGNLLNLGSTSYTWSLGTVFDNSAGPALFGISNTSQLVNNAYYNTQWVAKGTSWAHQLVLASSGSWEFKSASGTAGSPITFVDKMILTSNGSLLLGTSTTSSYLADINGDVRTTGKLFIGGSLEVLTISNANAYFSLNAGTRFIGNAGSFMTGGTSGFGIRTDAIVYSNAAGSIPYHYLTSDYALFSTQTTANNLGTGNPASAVLEARSTTKGFLPPRMTTTQKNAIATPAAGLVVYDTTTNKLCCYNGTTWNDLF